MRRGAGSLLGIILWIAASSAAELAPLPTEISRADLLQHPAVQKELKLTPEQVEKVRKLFLQHREDLQEVWQEFPPNEASGKWQELTRALRKDAVALLTPDQRHRFWQIDFQSANAMAFDSMTFARPDIDKRLGLSDDQRQRLRALQAESNKKNQEIFRTPNRGQMQAEMGKVRKADKEQTAALLTDEQKQRWRDLIGAPFVVNSFDSFSDLRSALGKWIRDDFGKAQAEARKTGKPIFALFRCEP